MQTHFFFFYKNCYTSFDKQKRLLAQFYITHEITATNPVNFTKENLFLSSLQVAVFDPKWTKFQLLCDKALLDRVVFKDVFSKKYVMCQYISLLGEIKWWKLENYKVKGFLSYTRLKHYSYGHSHCKIHILHWLHSQITS